MSINNPQLSTKEVNKEQNNFLVNRILENIPKEAKPAPYLSNMLDISLESAYRRFSGKIPFTFEEISKLSLTLNFSVDDIIGVKVTDSKALFELQADELVGSSRTFSMMLQKHLNYSRKLAGANRSEAIIAMRHLTIPSILPFETLFKFFYYKWTHQMEDVPFDYFFSDVVIPEEIETLLSEIKKVSQNLKTNETTIICNPSVCQTTIKEIQYYAKRGLINKDELQLLKQDLLDWVDSTGRTIKTGHNEQGSRCNYFLSSFDIIESNSIYTELGEQTESQFWIYTMNPLTISKPGVCKMHKEWFNSLKRYSTYITQSNEILQAEFLNKQKEYIDLVES